MIDNYDNYKKKGHYDMRGFLNMQYRHENGIAPPPETDMGEPVYAYVNHGRWVASCPHLPCRSALFLSKGQRLFLCTDPACEDKCWHEVIFPSNHEAIEAVLDKRPHKAFKNWYTNETIADLEVENTKHGV